MQARGGTHMHMSMQICTTAYSSAILYAFLCEFHTWTWGADTHVHTNWAWLPGSTCKHNCWYIVLVRCLHCKHTLRHVFCMHAHLHMLAVGEAVAGSGSRCALTATSACRTHITAGEVEAGHRLFACPCTWNKEQAPEAGICGGIKSNTCACQKLIACLWKAVFEVEHAGESRVQVWSAPIFCDLACGAEPVITNHLTRFICLGSI